MVDNLYGDREIQEEENNDQFEISDSLEHSFEQVGLTIGHLQNLFQKVSQLPLDCVLDLLKVQHSIRLYSHYRSK